jgi:hypothetical protein
MRVVGEMNEWSQQQILRDGGPKMIKCTHLCARNPECAPLITTLRVFEMAISRGKGALCTPR